MPKPVINIKFFADLAQFSTQLQNAERSLDKTGRRMQRLGTTLTASITAPLVALGAVSTRTFANFEQELAKVEAVSGATGAQMVALRNNAEDLGASTRFAASEVAALQLSLSKLGFSPDEILQSTDAILQLSLATGEDLAQSATVAASTLRGFGLEADETQRVVDVMAASFSTSALNLSKFETAMAVVAPVAATAGVSLEEVTGQLAVLVNAGIDASTAGTGLRNIFLDIAAKGLTFEDALAKINNSTNKNATALQLFGKRGATVATVLATNAAAAGDFASVYRDAGGEAARMARIMDDTLEGSFLRVKSAVESAQIAVGEAMAPALRDLADAVADAVSGFKDFSPETQKLIVVTGAFAAAAGPAVVIVGTLTRNVAALIPVVRSLTVAIAANPIGALAVAVTAVAGSVLLANSRFRSLTDATEAYNDITVTATQNIAKEKSELERYLAVAKNDALSKEERQRAIENLNRLSPEYLGNLSLENINTDKAAAATRKYVDALLLKAKVIAAEEKLVEVQKQLLDLQLGTNDAVKPSLWQNLANALKSGGDQYRFIANSVKTSIENANAEGAALTELQGKLTAFLQENESLISSNDRVAESFKNVASATGSGGRGPLPQVEAVTPVNPFVGLDPATQLAESATAALAELNNTSLENAREELRLYQEEQTRLQELAGAVSGAIQGAFDSMSQGIVSGLGKAESGLGRFAQALAATALKIISILLSQSIANSITNATQSAAGTGPAAIFTQPAFIATLVGGVLGAFAAIPKFATGGIVGGSSFVGDKILARLNSGELVLNADQQSRLLGLLDAGGRIVQVPYIASTEVAGENLRIVLDTYDQNSSRNG